MARPRAGYHLSDGSRTVGTTTITGRWGDSGGLVAAANKLGLEGKTVQDEWYDKGAAGAGTFTHDLIQAHREGRSIEEAEVPEGLGPEMQAAAHEAFASYERWSRGYSGAEFVALEEPLVCECSAHLPYGGTPDAVAVFEDRWILFDWKSGGTPYPSVLLQLAAYVHLVSKSHGVDVVEAHLLRVPKAGGEFHHDSWLAEKLEPAWQMFVDLRRAYETEKALRKML